MAHDLMEETTVAEETDRPAGWVAPLVLVAGAFGVVFAGVDSAVFDLERHLAPKALVLHLTALVLLVSRAPAWDRRGWGAWEAWGAAGTFLALFVAWSALSTVFSANRWIAFQGWGISFSSLVLYLSARRIGAKRRRWVVAGVLAAVAVAAGIGAAQAYGADWWWLSENRPPGGTFGNRNFLAHVTAIGLGPMLAFTARARRRWLPLLLPGLATLVLTIVLTRSRAAWLAAGASVLVTALVLGLAWRRSRATSGSLPWGRLAVAGVFIALAAVAAAFLPNRLEWRTSAPYAATLQDLGEYREGSGAGRLVQYRTSLQLAADRPVLGVGPGNWFVHYPRVTFPGDPAYSGHLDIPTNPWPSSDWIATVVERGGVGALLLLLAGAAAVLVPLGMWPGRGRAEAMEQPEAAAMAVGALTAACVAGLFDAVLLLAAPSFVVWTLAGLAAAEPTAVTGPAGSAGADGSAGSDAPRDPIDPGDPKAADSPHGASAPPRGGRRAPGILRGAAIAAALALVLVSAGSTAALVLTWQGDGTGALARAARVAPWEHRLHLILARRGQCEHAERAAELMPHHERAVGLRAACGG